MFAAIRNESLGDKLAQELRRAILSGDLGVGERLVEDTLADRYDVSRGPVRDALRQLSLEGLVESVRRGFVVVGLTPADVDDIFSLRLAIESLAMAEAIRRHPEWESTERLVQAMYRAAEEGGRLEFAALDVKFHRTFYELAGHRRLIETWNQLERTLTALLEMNPHKDSDLKGAADAHAELLRSVADGSADWRGLLEDHLFSARDRIKNDLFGRDADGS